MVDTPRTQAELITASADNSSGLYTNQNVRDFIVSVPILDDPTNASGLGTPAILRGTVQGHLASGVTVGAAGNNTVRAATAAGLLSAITYAINSRKFFELMPADYEIFVTGGLAVPAGSGFTWRGAAGSTKLIQYATNTPCLTFGDMANNLSNTCTSYSIDGVTCQYGVDQTGNTSANMIQIGQSVNCSYRNITSQSFYTGSVPSLMPNRGIYITSGSSNSGSFTNNVMQNIKVAGAQTTLFDNSLFSQSNLFNNISCNQGLGAVASLAGPAVNLGGPSGLSAGDVYNKLYIGYANVGGGQILSIALYTSFVLNGVLIEEWVNGGFGATGIIFNNARGVINGLRFLNPHSKASESASTASQFVYLFQTENAVINGLSILWSRTGLMDSNVGAVFGKGGTDEQPKVDVTGAFIFGTSDNETQFLPTIDATVPSWVVPRQFLRYVYDGIAAQIVGAEMTVTSTMTLYGHYVNTNILVPASLGAVTTITLAKTLKASGAGSTGLPLPGNTVHIRRLSGTFANNLIVLNGAAGTTLTTNTTSNVDLYYRFDGTNWVAFT